MEFSGLKKLRFATAREALTDVQPGPEARRLLADNPDPATFLQRLVEHGLWVDAIRVMAVFLPRREATWWACLNARASMQPDDPPELVPMLEAAEAWVFKPSDELGQKAFALAEATEMDSAPAYAALAAFWAGGNLAPPESGVVVPPGDGLSGTAAAAAVLLAASRKPLETEAWYRSALQQAVDIARGGSGRT